MHEQFEALIRKTPIRAEDQDLILNFFTSAEIISDMAYLLAHDPTQIHFILETLRSKKEALNTNDEALWRSIVDAEKEHLMTLPQAQSFAL